MLARRLVAAAAVALLLLLAAVWLAHTGDRRDVALASNDLTAPAPPPADLRAPDALLAPAAVLPTSTRESPALPRGPLHGRLVDAETRAPLELERVVLLASPDNSVAETLRSTPDGRFTSTRAFPRGTVRAWIKDMASGALLVRHEADFDPERAGDWLVPVPAPTAATAAEPEDAESTLLHGRVV